jgi:hypothetical protein
MRNNALSRNPARSSSHTRQSFLISVVVSAAERLATDREDIGEQPLPQMPSRRII